MTKLLLPISMGIIGAVFLIVAHRKMKTPDPFRAPIISPRTIHLIGLLLIYGGVIVYLSLLVYLK